MVKSALRYLDMISRTILSGDRSLLIRDAGRWTRGTLIPGKEDFDPMADAQEVAGYLLRAFENSKDKGAGSYHLGKGWGTSYPETTGYIIPSLFDHYTFSGDERETTAALKAADWLVEIQKPSGGWQGGRIGENRPEVIFNSAQVIRGLARAYKETGNQKYLDSLKRGADWICDNQDGNGYWKKNALMDEHRVYDSFVDTPLLLAYKLTDIERYKETAIRNLDWIIDSKQHLNGWFEDCDNTVKHNNRPILHTIAYTIDGLIDCGFILGNEKYVESGRKAADVLLSKFVNDGILNGRYNSDWRGSEHFICTGGAQMAIVWLKLDQTTQGQEYMAAAHQMLSLLSYIKVDGGSQARGSITGSYPLWGRYEPFASPNWASKFYLDALILYLLAKKKTSY